MRQEFSAIKEYSELDDIGVKQVISSYRPAIIRGLVKDWPVVQLAKRSSQELLQYLADHDSGVDVDAIMLRPEHQGRVFYNEALDGFNFIKNRLPLTKVLEQLFRYAQFPTPPSVAVQSALMSDCLPSLLPQHRMPVLSEEITPRIWVGNKITTPTHIDGSDNIACVVSGRRQFVLFPPEQIANLYIGPLDFAPTPSPISMVNLREPDVERYPKFQEALKHAQTAVLEPGDAIFIPNLWWHHVESLDQINILMNYWWGGSNFSTENKTSPYGLLMQALLGFRDLPAAQREAWGSIFEHYVFSAEHPASHLPERLHGVLKR
ncbi:cupin-like domain-containing protein [Undibacterium sp. LX40W]|uniref:Cupin-like domain-containing protein n=1 Tax=Undibacterium nitidum TaxID=2762298 RepID=A0A923HR52_9BURK|nr:MULTISPECIES: cupin-like domain-containing protein [Undibacterium]MBC3881765.1 cupin-like domain-containing protein [Undibacterium nitidum]MBC3892238.1 cupin-like domain-containing protein [Undibacterium sp. LX40W]